MMRFLIIAALLLAGPATAVQELTGQTASGAFYTASAPDDWVPADGLSASYVADLPRFGSGELLLDRLTQPLSQPACEG